MNHFRAAAAAMTAFSALAAVSVVAAPLQDTPAGEQRFRDLY
jgi:hypothetical protein